MRKIIAAYAFLASLLACAPAQAQNTTGLTVATCGTVTTAFVAGRPGPFTVDPNGNLCISGTITATLGGFTPSSSGARGTQLSVTTSDSSGTLPTGAVVVVGNTDTTNPIYCNVNGVAATVSDLKIPANSWFAFTIPAAQTTLHCIATGGTVLANMTGGSGLATGAGGGGGSGGGGGAITAASGAFAAGSLSAGAMVDLLTMRGTKAPGTAATNSLLTGGIYTAAGITLTDGQQAAIQFDSAGNVKVSGVGVSDGSTSAGQTFSKTGCNVTTAAPSYTTAQSNPCSMTTAGDIRTVFSNSTIGLATGTANVGGITGAVNVTPTDCSGTITTGATAQNAFTAAATRRGFVIANIDTSEVLWFSLTGTAAASGTGSFPLAPATATTFASLSSYFAALGSPNNTALSVIAATTAHKFSCTVW